MIYPVYSVRDVKVGFDVQFLVQANVEAAKRSFEMAVNNPGSMMGFKPSDFELYEIGSFDTDKGVFSGNPVPSFVIGGAEIYAKSER